jgi:hypothetical protein
MASNGRRRPAHSKGGVFMRKFILAAVLTLAALLLTIGPALADSTGPGI